MLAISARLSSVIYAQTYFLAGVVLLGTVPTLPILKCGAAISHTERNSNAFNDVGAPTS